MFTKLIVLAFLAIAAALPREYPAGVHPAVCPNYPYCEPGILARFTPEGMPIPQWGLPSGAASQYPAGVHPAVCPNYPYCEPGILSRYTPEGMPIPQWGLPSGAASQYPAGVHPAVCPNYPYCEPGILSRFTPEGQPIPEWGMSPATHEDDGQYHEEPAVPEAAKYPADFDESQCPNYPFCS